MSEYLKHIYSGRIYQVMRDHGPDHPYLWSPWEFSTRYPGQRRWDEFFRPCEKPETMPTKYDISILEEMAWEDRKLRGTQPITVRAPSPVVRPKPKTKSRPTQMQEGGLTIQDLALEVGCTPGQARAILRKAKVEKPQGGWRWPSSEEAEPIRKLLRRNLK